MYNSQQALEAAIKELKRQRAERTMRYGPLYNAQDMLAVERARFRADCAARAIRTAADAEKHMCRIAVARAEVVSQ